MAREFRVGLLEALGNFLGFDLCPHSIIPVRLEIWSTLLGDKTYRNFWLLRSRAFKKGLCEFLRVITISLYMQFLLLR